MRLTTMLRRGVVPSVLLTVVAIAGPAPASAAPGRDELVAELGRQATTPAQLQRQIDLQLRLAPGGRQTAKNEVSYNHGRLVITFAEPGAARIAAAPDCPADWFCFYDHTDFGTPRGRLHDCGWQDLARYAWSDRIESTVNNTGTLVVYQEHADGGDPANGHRLDYELWTDGNAPNPSVRKPNSADHVNRLC